MTTIPILYEDNHLLIVNKPSGWVVQGASPDQLSLLDWGKGYLKEKYNKPGNVFLGVVSRLDSWVTGAVPFARTSKAAARINEQLRAATVLKLYWALVEDHPPKPDGTLVHWLVRDDREAITRAFAREQPQSQKGELRYRTLGETDRGTLLEIELITGRKHQIRAQLTALGCPIIGDRKYGATRRMIEGIGLHCRRLAFEHPTQEQRIDVVAPLPEYWPEFSPDQH
ncbi:RluA family pseudouridine synthase [Pirellulaceae bacterium SH467]|jgi:23S rRNA pseudouridine1911/1915/1917 synthase